MIIENYPEGKEELAEVPNHPQKPEWGKRQVPFSRELWIEKEDYQESPPKGYFRLSPGAEVRLRYGFVVKCTGMKDGAVPCIYYADSRSGTPGADKYKVKGNIHWVSAKHAQPAEVRLYDRLYRVPEPDGPEDLNPDSLRLIRAYLEPSLRVEVITETLSSGAAMFQFERHGYFIFDPKTGAFNRTVTLRDSWQK